MRQAFTLCVLAVGCLEENPNFVDSGDGSGTQGPTDTGSLATSETPTSTMQGGSESTTSDTGTTGGMATSMTSMSTESTSETATSTATTSTTDGPTAHIMFVTSDQVSGGFGTLATVDRLCTNLAVAANLPGTYKAVISGQGETANGRITITGPIDNVMGERLADDEADLWDGALLNPVFYNEKKQKVFITVWTGTDVSGAATMQNCVDWSGAGGDIGRFGRASDAAASWIDVSNAQCTLNLGIYCISQ